LPTDETDERSLIFSVYVQLNFYITFTYIHAYSQTHQLLVVLHCCWACGRSTMSGVLSIMYITQLTTGIEPSPAPLSTIHVVVASTSGTSLVWRWRCWAGVPAPRPPWRASREPFQSPTGRFIPTEPFL
jgi:hypothetical protein